MTTEGHSKNMIFEGQEKIKGTKELAEGIPSGQMPGHPQCFRVTTEKIDDIKETRERD